MANTNLIIALVFAGVFGTALVYLLLWYIHRYIHKRCLDLEHWFHILLPHRSKPTTTVYVEKVEHREHSKHRSHSAKRERGRSERAHSRKHESRDRDLNADWPRQRDVERARPAMPMGAPMQPPQQPYGQPYYQPLGWHDQRQGAGQMAYPQPTMPMPWQAQGTPQVPLFAMPAGMGMPQQPFPQMGTKMPERAHYQPQYPFRDPPQYRQPYAKSLSSGVPKTSQQESTSVKTKSPRKRARRVKVDHIHICNEYSPIILEALKKAAPPSPSSSSSSSSSSATQEVPRSFIPRATPGFADPPPFQFSPYEQMAPQTCDVPRSYPRQWRGNGIGDDGPHVKARYAPFTPMSGHTARPWGMKAHTRDPARNYNIPRSRTYERRRQRTSDGEPSMGRFREAKAKKENDTTVYETIYETVYETELGGHQKERVDRVRNAQPDASVKEGRNSVPKPVKKGSPVAESVLLFSPMPSPVVEEPRTPPSERPSKFPNVPNMPSASGRKAHPKASSAPVSPISQVRSTLMSPTSPVSSLSGGSGGGR